MKKVLFAALSFVLSTSANAFIINGSLTGPVRNGVSDPPGVPPGWTVITQTPDTNDINNNGGVPQLMFAAPPTGPSPDGGTWVGMGATGEFGEDIFESFGQTVTGLSVGTSYDLSWFAGNFGADDGTNITTDPNAIEVLIDSNSIGSGPLLAVGENWFAQSLSFTATSTSLELEFRPLNIVVSYMSIDGIALKPSVIPVPAAVWLFGSGLIGLLGLSRRRNALSGSGLSGNS